VKRIGSLFLFFAVLCLISLFAVFRQHGKELCAVDGTRIRAVTRVTVNPASGELHFCSLCCAHTYLQAHPEIDRGVRDGTIALTVVDEVSGEPLDPSLAYWVESSRFSRRENNCRLHVFRDPGEAARHILRYDGREMVGYLSGLGLRLPWAAPFAAEKIGGGRVSLEDFRGRVVFLRFWNTGNPYTDKDLGYLAQAHQRWQRRGFTVVAVNVEQSRQQVEHFLNGRALPFPVLLDPRGEIADLYKVKGFPTGFLLDRSGIIRNRSIGEILPDLMQPLIDPLL